MEFTRCYGCMRELATPGAVCPHCGFDNTKDPAKQPSHVLPCGTVLNGQYIVGKSLGQGGFGITYIGFDLNLEIRVCIKEYFPEGAAMRSSTQSRLVYWGSSETAQGMMHSRESFVKEARKAVKLRDLSHVVSVWGVFPENETTYIVMDYIEGETLKHNLIRTQRTLSEKKCVELFAPVISDLETAHERGIIHRDIKPENLMLTPDGELMLLDMGAAKDLGRAAQNGSLSSTTVVSHGFSPLEQYQKAGSIGPWTDVYAVCATMYYCVTGRLLPSPVDRMVDDRVSFSALSPALAEVLKKGLALKSEERIQNMGELLRGLQAAVTPQPRPTPQPAPKPTPQPAPKPTPQPVPSRNSAQQSTSPAPAPAPKPKPKPKPWIWGLAAAVVLTLIFTLSGTMGGARKAATPTSAAVKKSGTTVSSPAPTAKASATAKPSATPKPSSTPSATATPKPTVKVTVPAVTLSPAALANPLMQYYTIGNSENTFAGLYDRMCVSLDLKEHPLPKADTKASTYKNGDYEYVCVLKDDNTSNESIGYVRNSSGKDIYLIWQWAGYHKDGSIIGLEAYYTTKGQYLGNIQRDYTAGTSTSSHRCPYFIPGEPLNKD